VASILVLALGLLFKRELVVYAMVVSHSSLMLVGGKRYTTLLILWLLYLVKVRCLIVRIVMLIPLVAYTTAAVKYRVLFHSYMFRFRLGHPVDSSS